MVPTNEGTFKLLTGEPKVYVKTGESGNKRVQTFCPECGTPIYLGPMAKAPEVVGLRVGTIRQRDQLIPTTNMVPLRAGVARRASGYESREKQPEFDPKGGFGR